VICTAARVKVERYVNNKQEGYHHVLVFQKFMKIFYTMWSRVHIIEERESYILPQRRVEMA